MTYHKTPNIHGVKQIDKWTTQKRLKTGDIYFYNTYKHMSKDTVVVTNKEIIFSGSHVNNPVYYTELKIL